MLSSAGHKKCLKYHVMDDVIDVGKELLITIIIIFHLACKQVSYIILCDDYANVFVLWGRFLAVKPFNKN